MAQDTALLVIDVQAGMFDGTLYQPEDLIQRLQGLIAAAHTASIPVIYVQHVGDHPDDPLHPSREGHAIHAAIAPQPGEVVVQKHDPDSFMNTTLQQELEKRGIKKLVVAGLQTELCVDTTCRRAYSLGYEVTLVSDAHSTYDSRVLTARQIIDHHNANLSGFAVRLQPAAEVTFG